MSKHHDAIAAFQQGQIVEACRLLDELVHSEPSNPEVWNDWATAQLAAGAIEKAESGFSRALQLNPEHLDATTGLGLLYLSQGKKDQALPLLRAALPKLPPHQQELLGNLLNERAATKVDSLPQRLRILVIHDYFPDPHSAGLDLQLTSLLRSLRDQQHEVTFIARDDVNRRHCEPLLRELGIQAYGGDAEHLLLLGKQVESNWSLANILGATKFDLTVLSQTFSHGISVAEQYLREIRRSSPGTRIAIMAEGVVKADTQRVPESADQQHKYERTQDLVSREAEVFLQADLAIASTADNQRTLQAHNIRVTTGEQLPSESQNILAKPAPPKALSILRIEDLFAEKLASKKGEKRLLGQLESYVVFAQQLLREDKVLQAREQLRHVFGRLTGPINAGQFHSQVFALLKRCYRELGESELAEACAKAARHSASEPAAGETIRSVTASSTRRRKVNEPLISVIVPTFNRLPILQKCLAALEAQTLSPKKFEVIVIDDGSSDGTAEFMQSYQPSFRLHSLRQTNSGTGAARRNGVNHATGEYLLLMNDDTICDPDVIEQHLRVQQSYPDQRWAVLGDFEYPEAARQRALTHYFCIEPFMFPQVSMEAGCPYGYSYFITCNLSIRRDVVVEAGSFDSTYKLSEDTELGIRMFERGYRVLYHPEAHAWHDHLPYFSKSLIRRAHVYGADYFYMFRNHPRVMKEWAMPIQLTGMDAQNAKRILGYVEEHRQEVEEAVAALEKWDSIDFEPLLNTQTETASMVLGLFRQAVPAIHWFYLFETMLNTMVKELGLPHLSPEPMTMHAAGSGD